MDQRSRTPALDTTTPSLYTILASTFGGVGLFLLGIRLLTDGLRLAAGHALEELLERSTATRARGLAAGMLITSLVQSSTAVTLATIGFVNTGLLSLGNALWVVFGANVGTTMNAWLVAWLGFGFNIDTFALPFIGTGAVLMLGARGMRIRAFGQALAGFGVLFLGIDVLKSTFASFGASIDLGAFIIDGVPGYLVLLLLGTLMTVMMQTSGAVIAIVITAASGGLLSIEAACAMVIGTNIGSTFAAIVSAIGATSNARRLAASHVFFNVVTGTVALLLLPALIGLLGLVRDWFGQPASPAVMVAMFHTTFNVLGVLLMVPTSAWLLRTLARCFTSREDETAHPQYLDGSSLSIPDLALRALRLELGRTQELATACVAGAATRPASETAIRRQRDTLKTLSAAITAYTSKLSAGHLPTALVDVLARSLRVLQYQENAAESSLQAAGMATALPTLPPGTQDTLAAFIGAASALATAANTGRTDFTRDDLELRLRSAEEAYSHLKEALLIAGAHAQLSIRDMQDHLRHASLLRRAAEQTAKAVRYLCALDEGTAPPHDDPAEADEAELA